mgnify:CR=1 FL=1
MRETIFQTKAVCKSDDSIKIKQGKNYKKKKLECDLLLCSALVCGRNLGIL